MGSFTRAFSLSIIFLFAGFSFDQPPATADTGGAKPAVAQKSAVAIVLFTSWRDPSEGAFTLNVPQKWNISGGTSRNASIDPRHFVYATSPNRKIQIFIGDPKLVPNQVPDRMMQMGGFREGQVIRGAWGGPVLLARYQPGEQYARGYVSRKLCRAPSAVNASTLQEASRELSARAAEYGRATGAVAQAWVGEAVFRCGQRAGYVRASTVLAAPAAGAGAQVWDVLELSGYIAAAPGDEKFARYVMDNMVASFQMDPQWQARQARTLRDVTEAVTRAQQQMAATVAQQARAEAKSNQIDVMSGWEKNNKARDAAMQRDSEVRRGITTAEDPVQGSRTVSNDYNYYWTRPDGSIVGTTTDTPPDYSSGWRMMSTH